MELVSRDEKISYIGKVFTMLSDCITITDIWGYYLYDTKTEQSHHLSRLAGIIWFCSLYDTLDARSSVFNKYNNIAVENSLENTIHWLECTKELFDNIASHLSTYEKEEQVFAEDIRNTLVHGWLNRKHRESFKIKFVENEILKREKVTKKEHWEMTHIFYEYGWGRSIDSLSKRYLDKSSDMWESINLLYSNRKVYHKEIYQDIGVSI